MYVRTKVTRRLGDDNACNSLPIGLSLMCNAGNSIGQFYKYIFADPASAPSALPSPVPLASSSGNTFSDKLKDAVHNATTGTISDNQRRQITGDCADNLVRASGGKMTREQALAQCKSDVDATVPPGEFNWKPYAIIGGIAVIGLAMLRGRR